MCLSIVFQASELTLVAPDISTWAPIVRGAIMYAARWLIRKEATDLQADVSVSLHADISPSVLIASDIDLQY